ncbi:MAG: low molecular weight protein arginine phosphatase [candidate division KSB1 bacterium]|nr:low molecular weight protein arginine phosphatase [candidate division KSB1 bacterium]
MSRRFRILFVCSGNSCRSPMAEGILRAKLPPHLRHRILIRSAGTLGIDDAPATPLAIRAAAERGADISAHRSQGVSKKLVDWADLILVMEQDHVRFLKKHYPEAGERVYLLRTFARPPQEIADNGEVPDPIGGDLTTYRECADLIAREVDRIVPVLNDLVVVRETGERRDVG